MLDVPGSTGSIGTFRDTGKAGVDRASSGLYRTGDTRVLVVNPSHLMVASHGHGPRHGLFLLGVACASTLLSYAVGITASLDHFTHFYEFGNARIIPQLGSWHRARYPVGFAQTERLIAAAARQSSLPDSLAGFDQHQSHHAHSFAHHAPQTKFKEEDDDFLDKLHREYGVGI
jgi:hypothetical protein